MNLASMGEFGLIKNFFSNQLTPVNVLGVGDDCAHIPGPNSGYLVSTDMLIEDTHFTIAHTSPFDLGHKALAVNLSDLAAKGGRPLYAFLSIALNAKLDTNWVEAFSKGFLELAKKEGLFLLGGDTVSSPALCAVNVCVIGEAPPTPLKLRKNAQAGDLICVSGTLGDSAAGLALLQLNVVTANNYSNADEQFLIARHLRPKAQLSAGAFLARKEGVHAMMDLSDGLNSDLNRILELTNLSADIDLGDLPLSQHLQQICYTRNWSPTDFAAAGGEDYELLFTCNPSDFETLKQELLLTHDIRLSSVGQLKHNSGKTTLRYLKNGQSVQLGIKEFQHFRQ